RRETAPCLMDVFSGSARLPQASAIPARCSSQAHGRLRGLHSFPTRRSSDLHVAIGHTRYSTTGASEWQNAQPTLGDTPAGTVSLDRKSTRLNSSHVSISYAVFCLKKKKNVRTWRRPPGRRLMTRASRPETEQ